MAWLVAAQEPFDKCYIGGNAELDKVTDIPTSSNRFATKTFLDKIQVCKGSRELSRNHFLTMFGSQYCRQKVYGILKKSRQQEICYLLPDLAKYKSFQEV